MKKLLLALMLLAILLLSANIVFSQGVTPTGQIRGTTETLGASKTDSMQFLPVRNLTKWLYANTNMPYIAGLQVSPTDTLPYYMKDPSHYFRMLTIADTLRLTTIGTGGPATLIWPTLNIPQYTGSAGTVTSIGLTSSAAAYSISPTTITSSGVFSIIPTSTSSKFVKGDGSLDANTYLTSVLLSSGTGINVAGASPTYTVSATGSLTAGAGINVSGSFPTYTVTNTSTSSGGTVTSIGLTSSTAAYSVSPTTITSSGVFSIIPTSTSSKFVKGDGSLDASTYLTSVAISSGTGISVAGSSPTYTVSATGSLSSGTGINIAGSFPTYTVTNTSPSSGGTVTSITYASPLTGGTVTTSGTVAIPAATSITDGYLTQADWNTFNNKGSGSVISIGMNVPSIFSVTPTSISTTGTFSVTLTNEAPHTFLAGATSGTTTPTFRAIVSTDLPVLSYVTSVNVTVPTDMTVSGSPITSAGTIAISHSTLNTISDAANFVYSGANGNTQTITLGAARTFTATSLLQGVRYVFIVNHGATAFQLTWGTTVKVSYGGAGAPPQSATNNAIDLYFFTYDGTNIYVDYSLNDN